MWARAFYPPDYVPSSSSSHRPHGIGASWERGQLARADAMGPLVAGKMPALVWSAPQLQGRVWSGKQVQLHTCIRPLEWEPRFPGPDGIRARLASSPRRPRMGPARAQARGMPVRPVLPSTSLLPRNCWRPWCRLESSRWGTGVELGHAAISRACPRARAFESPKRRWAGGGNRGTRSRFVPQEPFAVAAYAAAASGVVT